VYAEPRESTPPSSFEAPRESQSFDFERPAAPPPAPPHVEEPVIREPAPSRVEAPVVHEAVPPASPVEPREWTPTPATDAETPRNEP